MSRLPYRWSLPLGHFLIDATVLILWLWHADTARIRLNQKTMIRPIATPVLLQESGAQGWDFSHHQPPVPEFVFMFWGNMPAGIISWPARPEASFTLSANALKYRWFLIHESVSSVLWFLFGLHADRGTRTLRLLLRSYLILRCAMLATLLFSATANLVPIVFGLLWLGLTALAVARSVLWAGARTWRSLRPLFR